MTSQSKRPLLPRVLRRAYASVRRAWYALLSDRRCPQGIVCHGAVLVQGIGALQMGAGTQLGFRDDAEFLSSYLFFSLRTPQSSIRIGNDCWICNHFAAISEGPGIVLGNKVLVGTGVTIIDSDFHELAPDCRIGGTPKMGAVIIEDNVMIGDRATILKGCHIGKDSVVAAGAVVCGKFPAGSLLGGAPARVLRSLYGENHG